MPAESTLHIVCATDGSAGAIAAATWTHSHLARSHPEITLLNVMRMTVDDGLRDRYAEWMHASEEVLSKTQAVFRTTKCNPVSVVGNPAPSIAKFAHDRNADLIVLGHSGHSALGGMGSIAFGVLHHADVPVVVVPENVSETPEFEASPRPLRIVLATDGSPESQAATAWLNLFARGLEAKISVLAVTSEAAEAYQDVPPTGDGGHKPVVEGLAAPAWGYPGGVYWLPSTGGAIGWQEAIARARDRAEEALKQASQELTNCPPDQSTLGSGDRAQAILEHASTYKADLIVMGRREHSALGNLLASVSYAVVQRSSIPVAMISAHQAPAAG